MKLEGEGNEKEQNKQRVWRGSQELGLLTESGQEDLRDQPLGPFVT